MEAYDLAVLWDWVSFAVRWLHVITAIAWIGSSFYFIALDLGLRRDGDLVRVDAEAGTLEVMEADFENRSPATADLSANESGIGRELFAAFRQNCGLAQDGASLVV